jgi:hypothetical protein
MMENEQKELDWIEEPPPFWKSWKIWYGVVLGMLAFLIVVFYLLTVSFK